MPAAATAAAGAGDTAVVAVVAAPEAEGGVVVVAVAGAVGLAVMPGTAVRRAAVRAAAVTQGGRQPS